MYQATVGKHQWEISQVADTWHIDDKETGADIVARGEKVFEVRHNNQQYRVLIHQIDEAGNTVTLTINGKKTTVSLRSRLARLLDDMGLADALIPKIDSVKAPMPGLVKSVSASIGQSVEKGDALMILEAMKMENVIKSPGPGTISEIHVSAGETVEKGALMIKFA